MTEILLPLKNKETNKQNKQNKTTKQKQKHSKVFLHFTQCKTQDKFSVKIVSSLYPIELKVADNEA